MELEHTQAGARRRGQSPAALPDASVGVPGCFYALGERTESQCNGRGSCQLDGTCVCADGFTGDRCATPPRLLLMATDDF